MVWFWQNSSKKDKKKKAAADAHPVAAAVSNNDWGMPGVDDWSAPAGGTDWSAAGAKPTRTPKATHTTGWGSTEDTTKASKKKSDKTKGSKKEDTVPTVDFYGSYGAFHQTPKAGAAMPTPYTTAYEMWGAPLAGSSKTPPMMPATATATPSMALIDPFYGRFATANTYGQGLVPAQRALFGHHRPSVSRILWGMPPDKDPNVNACLQFIQDPQVRAELTEIGVTQFVTRREPGCFFLNASFRLPDRPNTPGFDWMTYDKLMPTYDRCIQQSVMYYDPGDIALVFVFLVSPKGNSIAMWRRKLHVDHALAQRYGLEIASIKKEMTKRDYRIIVDSPADLHHSWGMTPSTGPGLGMGAATPFPASSIGIPMAATPGPRSAWFSAG